MLKLIALVSEWFFIFGLIADKLAMTQEKATYLENVNCELQSQKSDVDEQVLKFNERNISLEAKLRSCECEKGILQEEVERFSANIFALEALLKDSESKVCQLIMLLFLPCSLLNMVI
jgi:peptidoglycan hydrolase CwlO-like protein